MEKKETLKDGSQVLVRTLTLKDLDKLMKFYRSLPDKDRRYLRVDVLNKDVVAQRIKMTKTGDIVRIVALHRNRIVADGTLEFSTEEWKKHQAELRVNVDKDFKHNGLVTILADDSNVVLPLLFEKANAHEERITAVDIQEPNLESVFLHLTGRALRD